MSSTRFSTFSSSRLIKKRLVYAIIISMQFFAGSARAENTKPTLWGIYGSHEVNACPLNNLATAKRVVAIGSRDNRPLMKKYGVTSIVDRYHSGLEHTFLWVVKTTEPHNLEEFAIELGIARFNNLKIVPLKTFEEDVVPDLRKLHGLEDMRPQKN